MLDEPTAALSGRRGGAAARDRPRPGRAGSHGRPRVALPGRGAGRWRTPSRSCATVAWCARPAAADETEATLIAAMLGRSGEQAYPATPACRARRAGRARGRRRLGAGRAGRVPARPRRRDRGPRGPGGRRPLRAGARHLRVPRGRHPGASLVSGTSHSAARPVRASTPASRSSRSRARTTACAWVGRSART